MHTWGATHFGHLLNNKIKITLFLAINITVADLYSSNQIIKNKIRILTS
jgi:hypothetical protein